MAKVKPKPKLGEGQQAVHKSSLAQVEHFFL